MLQLFRPALTLLFLFSLLTGVAYPVTITLAAQLAFPSQANGSLIQSDRGVMGSALIGQPFTSARYFWSRPSATGPAPYNAGASTGSNLGPLHPDLRKAITARIAAIRSADPSTLAEVPVDLVTTSGSGLDPHISPAAAYFQVARISRARGLPPNQVQSLVDAHIEQRTLGVLGEPRVNVLALNLALDRIQSENTSAH